MSLSRYLCVAAFSLLASVQAFAVVSWGGREAGTNAGAAWNYVYRNSASAIYLGEYGGEHWVLTCNHVSTSGVIVGGSTYSVVEGSAVQVGSVDLKMYKIDVPDNSTLKGLSNLKLADHFSNFYQETNPLVTMIGAGGYTQSSTPTTWKVYEDENGDLVWTTDLSHEGEEVQGFTYTSGRTKSWGTNYIDQFEYELDGNTYLSVVFDPFHPEGQGVTGDSGGGLFYTDPETGEIELVGVMSNILFYQNQPGGTVMEGNMTLFIPIADVVDMINTILYANSGGSVPEPSSAALLLAGGFAFAFRRRRK